MDGGDAGHFEVMPWNERALKCKNTLKICFLVWPLSPFYAASAPSPLRPPDRVRVSIAPRFTKMFRSMGAATLRCLKTLPSGSRGFSSRRCDTIRPGSSIGLPLYGPAYGVETVLGADGLPTDVDWRNVKGAVTGVKNQLSCATCYIMAALGALETLNFMKTRKSVELSAQHIIDCSTVTNDISGGLPESVYNFIIKNKGVVKESDYPYSGIRWYCEDMLTPGVTMDGWRYIAPTEEALKYAVAHQVVAAGVKCTNLFLQHVGPGVLDGRTYPDHMLNHAVQVIGYYPDKDEDGKQLWRVLNSEGTGWGVEGVASLRFTGKKGGPFGLYRHACVPVKLSSTNGLVSTKCESCTICF